MPRTQFQTATTETKKMKLAKYATVAALVIGAAYGQEAEPTTDYVTQLTDGLSGTFGQIMAVVIPIMLAITGVIWFRKFRNKG